MLVSNQINSIQIQIYMKRVSQSSKQKGIPCSDGISVQEVGGKALQVSDKFVLILHIF